MGQVTGQPSQDFDNQTLAVLRGRLVRYLMRSREITVGRAAQDHTVDVDLTLEGPASKVSRKQAIIKLTNSGEFYLANEGSRPVMVNGKPILCVCVCGVVCVCVCCVCVCVCVCCVCVCCV